MAWRIGENYLMILMYGVNYYQLLPPSIYLNKELAARLSLRKLLVSLASDKCIHPRSLLTILTKLPVPLRMSNTADSATSEIAIGKSFVAIVEPSG